MRIEIEILYAPQYTAVGLTAVGLAAVGILAGDKGRTGSNATERNPLQLLDLVYYSCTRDRRTVGVIGLPTPAGRVAARHRRLREEAARNRVAEQAAWLAAERKRAAAHTNGLALAQHSKPLR